MSLNIHFNVFDSNSFDQMNASMTAVTLNNEGTSANRRKDFLTALEKFKQALEIKLKVYGEISVHVCISLSGLCDAYLGLNDTENATKEAKRMLSIAQTIECPEQLRIANEILDDCEKLRRKVNTR